MVDEVNLKLTIELVPRPLWGKSIYNCLSREEWSFLRRKIIHERGHKCEICSSTEGPLSLHEIWQYDDERKIQRFVGFRLLCSFCHSIKHFGRSQTLAREGKLDLNKLIEHFCKVNNCSIEEFKKHYNEVWDCWEQRSSFEWKQDIVILEDYVKGSVILKQILVDRRSSATDIDLLASFVKDYAEHDLDRQKYESSWKVVGQTVKSQIKLMPKEDVLSRKIKVDDEWIWYRNIDNPEYSCLGGREATEYIKRNDRLHPVCEECRKVLIFAFDEGLLKKITEEFLLKSLGFDFKIARDLGVFVAYAKGDKRKSDLIRYLENLLKSNSLKGRVSWRIGGKYLQDAAPHLFTNAKTLSYEPRKSRVKKGGLNEYL